ncbi:nSTAND3 domain-containing NTPase [Burkholderia contaminans]|uniref:nSTAND3 domain-containing NTPase n=1 Tax=Burkholderia contaminans TaxID=488447 RepID=UPI000F56583A|nr:restriction endonuclease [Burkholderia contaminans]RQT30513.1 hypothetical protein DF036_24365 [Burkholderia contaminans]
MYDFRTLSPLDFEELVRDLLQAEFGLLFESFGPGRDLGIDFRFATAEGSAVVQAKHYADARADALVRTARSENDKVARLKPARYIFATSVSLTPMLKAKLQDAMPAAPLAQQDILGRADLNNLLGRHTDVHKKHFKLWLASTEVLERILHSGVYNRTQAEMDVIKAMVPKFVQNDSVSEAEAILQKNGALIIAGEPGVGKSTLARMLVWLHAEQGWKIVVRRKLELYNLLDVALNGRLLGIVHDHDVRPSQVTVPGFIRLAPAGPKVLDPLANVQIRTQRIVRVRHRLRRGRFHVVRLLRFVDRRRTRFDARQSVRKIEALLDAFLALDSTVARRYTDVFALAKNGAKDGAVLCRKATVDPDLIRLPLGRDPTGRGSRTVVAHADVLPGCSNVKDEASWLSSQSVNPLASVFP